MADTHDEGDPPVPAWLIELGWQERYLVREMVARGGMGRVYEAWHRELGLKTALKIIDPGLMNDERALARFETEALTLRRLQEPTPHPNLARVLDFKITQGVGCLAMAFVQGPDLKTWCQQQTLDLKAQARLLLKVSRAAGYMHSHGVVHRDLKPSNILVHEQTQEPVIVDFGIVKPEGELTLTLTREAIGTAHYMAPEQLRTDRCEVGPQADVYALGVVLYELITDRLPYAGTLAEVMRSHASEELPQRPSFYQRDLPRELEVICLKALSLRRAERYANGSELAEDLDRWLRDTAIQARPLSPSIHWLRRASHHPALILAVTACVVFAAVGLWHGWVTHHEAALAAKRQQISETLTSTVWSVPALEAVARQVSQLPSLEAEGYLHKLRNAAFHQVEEALEEPRLLDEQVPALQSILAWCAVGEAPRAQVLNRLLADRQSRWETRVALTPPFVDVQEAFSLGQVRVEADALYPVSQPGRENLDRVFIKGSVPRQLEVKATFHPPATLKRYVGFCLRSSHTRHFVRLYGREAAQNLPQATHVAGMQRADFAGLLCLMREETLLATTPVFRSKPLSGPLQITARVEGSLLSGETSGGVRVEYRDLYMIAGPCDLGLDWPSRIRLTALTLQTRDLPRQPTPLESGDALAVQGLWLEAQGAYAALLGDPQHGAEAAYKIGECQSAQGRMTEAAETWATLLARQLRPWSSLACFRLWQHQVTAGHLDAAAPYLQQLLSAEPETLAMLRDLRAEQKQRIANVYRRQSSSLRIMQRNPEVEMAIQAHHLLGYLPVEVAMNFGFARHFNGTDETARMLFQQALKGVSIVPLSRADRHQMLLCLDMACWLDHPEKSAWIGNLIQRWNNSLAEEEPERGFLQLELARAHARQGRGLEALEITQKWRVAPLSPPRLKIAACLLEAALVMEDTTAFSARLKEALSVLNLRRHSAPTPLIVDGAMLGCAAQAWTPELMADILARLLTGPEESMASGHGSSLLAHAFLQDRALVTSLNQLIQGSEGKALFRDYCLRSRPLRELAEETFHRILDGYLQVILQAPPSAIQRAQIHDCVSCIVQGFRGGKFTETDLLTLITGLRSGEARQALVQEAGKQWGPKLQTALRTLFQHSPKAAVQ